MLPASVTRALVGGVVLFALAACGGGEGGDGARPTISPTRTPTATVPSPTRTGPDRTESPEAPSPTRTEEPTSEPTSEPTQEPTEESTQEPSQEPTNEPGPTRTADRTETPDEPATEGSSVPSEPASASPTATPKASETGDAAEESGEDAADEGIPTWVWWVLAALLLGAAVAIPLVVRARRRSAWRQSLVDQEAEVAWLARDLLPELRRGGSVEQVAGGWAVGRTRVSAAEDRLTVLESTAPDDVGRERARSLRDAVRRADAGMAQLTGPGPHDEWALDLDAIIDDLEHALRPAPGSDVAGPPA
jgi:hypothetical protein